MYLVLGSSNEVAALKGREYVTIKVVINFIVAAIKDGEYWELQKFIYQVFT